MAVMARQAKYHKFGRAIRRIMNAENVQVDNQEEAASRLTADGRFECNQRLLSNYMRIVVQGDKRTGRAVEKPRTVAPIEFVFAWGRAFPLTREQQMDLLDSWLEIQPEERKDALLDMCKALSEEDVPPEAVEDMLDFENQKNTKMVGGEGEGQTGDRDSQV